MNKFPKSFLNKLLVIIMNKSKAINDNILVFLSMYLYIFFIILIKNIYNYSKFFFQNWVIKKFYRLLKLKKKLKTLKTN